MRMFFNEYGLLIVEAVMGALVLLLMLEVFSGSPSICEIIKEVTSKLG